MLALGPSQVPVSSTSTWAFTRTSRFTEKSKLQFRSEFFNVFNHTNFGNPTTTVGSGNYGRITSALDARIIEFSLRLHY